MLSFGGLAFFPAPPEIVQGFAMPLGHDPERRTSGYPSPAPSTYLQTHPIAISGTSAVNNLNFDSGYVTCEVSSRLYA